MNTVLLNASAGSTVTQSLVEGVTSIAGDATSAVASVIPVALPIMGIMVIVGLGIKVFKKVSSK